MFSIFKQPSGHRLADLRVDLHSHLIPGIDDGAKSLDDSLALIKGLSELGFRKLITTPHVYPELYPNDRGTILGGYRNVQDALQQSGSDVRFSAAAEYFLDEAFEELLEKGALLCVHGQLVLVEISFIAPPPRLEDYLFRMRTKGYEPILAHPERYGYFGDDMTKYERLRDLGCRFQVNLLSIAGRYGRPVQKVAEKLLKQGWVEYLGTDCHNQEHLAELRELEKSRSFQRFMERGDFRNRELL